MRLNMIDFDDWNRERIAQGLGDGPSNEERRKESWLFGDSDMRQLPDPYTTLF